MFSFIAFTARFCSTTCLEMNEFLGRIKKASFSCVIVIIILCTLGFNQ